MQTLLPDAPRPDASSPAEPRRLAADPVTAKPITANPVAAKPVLCGSHLTLHYRLSLADSDADVISTFGERPATLQLGLGQLAEPLERCLFGLDEGARQVFDLDAGQAFGERNPDLIQKLARASFDANIEPGTEYEPGDLVDFPAPDGARFAGVLKVLTDEYALFDFNHPLAGQRVRFEVHILGVL